MAKSFKHINKCTPEYTERLELFIALNSSSYKSRSEKIPDVQQIYDILREKTNARRRRYHSLKNSNATLAAQQARKDYAKSVRKILKVRKLLHRMKRVCKILLRELIRDKATLHYTIQTRCLSLNK